MDLTGALKVLDAYEPDAVFAARSVARRGANSLLAEGESELSYPVSEGQVIEAMRTIVASMGDTEATRSLWKCHQATCAFYMIDAGRREYESGALYPRIAEELGIGVEQYVNRWADNFIVFLDSLQLQRFDLDSAAKYKLETILLHGGLPDDAWQQVWRNWILPGVRASKREPSRLIQWALSHAHDAPQLRTTTRDILYKGGLVVERLVAEAVKAAVDSIETGVVDDSARYGLPAAALASLEEALSAPRLRWPELRFDLETASMVFLEVPEINLGRHGGSDRTSVKYDVFAVGESVAPVRSDEVVATDVTGTWRICSFKIPLGAAAGFEVIVRCHAIGRLDQSSQRRIRWRVGPQRVWTFMPDRGGRWVCPPERSWRRPRKDVLYLVPRRMRLVCGEEHDACRVVMEAPLVDDWDGWTAYHVEGSAGGGIRLETPDGTPIEEWSLGQKCEISLECEDETLVGRLILDRLCPVYGLKLPDVVVDALDPDFELRPGQWSCEIQWGVSRGSVHVPLEFDERGYRLRAILQNVIDVLPDVVDDGEIRVSGPEGCGLLKRFTRVPLARPKLTEIGVDESGSLTAIYEVESGVDLTGGLSNKSVRVRREEAIQRLMASASLDAVAACFRDSGCSVSMNIILAGVSLEAEGIELPSGTDPLVIPEKGLDRFAGAALRIGASHGGGCEVALELSADGHDTVQLCIAGANGSYTDAIGFGELARMLPSSGDVTLWLKVGAGDLIFSHQLFKILRGLGLGTIKVDRSGKPARLVCDQVAALDMSVRVRDLTAPWRDGLEATLRAGEPEVVLEPAEFAFCEGRYGVWVQVADEWNPDVDLSIAPTVVFEITCDDAPDDLPVMGPYHGQLAQLLRYRAGLAERPSFRASTASIALHMLEADAEATVSALLHCLRPVGDGCAGLLDDGETVAELGRDIMRLEEYRHALSPATLRSLIAVPADGWSAADILRVMMALRIPLSDVRGPECACFEADELERAWTLHPYVGLTCTLMHSYAGEPNEASACVDRWLAGVGGSREKLLRELKVDTGVLRDVVEGRSISASLLTSAENTFASWIRASTQKHQVHTAQWVRVNLDAARSALRIPWTSAGPLSPLLRAIQLRECGERVKTISNLSIFSGALAVAALAHQVRYSTAPVFTQTLTGGHRDEATHEALTELLIQGLNLCPDVLGMDLFLTRLWWSIEAGDL